jgi:hypothetical protein
MKDTDLADASFFLVIKAVKPIMLSPRILLDSGTGLGIGVIVNCVTNPIELPKLLGSPSSLPTAAGELLT